MMAYRIDVRAQGGVAVVKAAAAAGTYQHVASPFCGAWRAHYTSQLGLHISDLGKALVARVPPDQTSGSA